MLLTATGVVRGLAPEDFAVVGLDGELVEGQLTAVNAEIVPMHAQLYAARSDIGAIIHTHARHLTAFALAHAPLPCRYEALLRVGQVEPVPVAPWGPRGSEASVRGIVEAVEAHPQTRAVLLANHGVLVFGEDPAAAAALLIALEEAAAMELDARSLGGAQHFPPGALAAVQASAAGADRPRAKTKTSTAEEGMETP